MSDLDRRLRTVRAPDETGAEARAWVVARRVYAERSVPHRRRRRTRLAFAPVAVALAATLAFTPAIATVHRWIDQTLGVKHARPALFSLPAPGTVLVAGRGGVWTVGADGARRRLGTWRDASWSPHALYVVVVQRNALAAVNRRGVTQWSVARPDVHLPRWYAPNGFRVAYLSGTVLRVIAGDGSGDHRVAAGAASVAPAWRPGHAYALAYVRRDDTVVVRDADTGALLWSHRVAGRPRALTWSGDGRRLLVLTTAAAIVYDGSGARVATVATRPAVRAGALSPDGRRLALLSADDVSVRVLGGAPHTLLAGPGLHQLAFSPDGNWLLVAWPAANQWVFIRVSGRPRIVAASHISQQFGAFPELKGWCCTAGGGPS